MNDVLHKDSLQTMKINYIVHEENNKRISLMFDVKLGLSYYRVGNIEGDCTYMCENIDKAIQCYNELNKTDRYNHSLICNKSFTASYIKEWCEFHISDKNSIYHKEASDLYDVYWETNTELWPSPMVYYEVGYNYKFSRLYLIRDEVKSPRRYIRERKVCF